MFCLPLMRALNAGRDLLAFTVPLYRRPDQTHFGWTGRGDKDRLPKSFALHIKFSGAGQGWNGTAFLPCGGVAAAFKIFDAFAKGPACLACADAKSKEH